MKRSVRCVSVAGKQSEKSVLLGFRGEDRPLDGWGKHPNLSFCRWDRSNISRSGQTTESTTADSRSRSSSVMNFSDRSEYLRSLRSDTMGKWVLNISCRLRRRFWCCQRNFSCSRVGWVNSSNSNLVRESSRSLGSNWSSTSTLYWFRPSCSELAIFVVLMVCTCSRYLLSGRRVRQSDRL